MARWRTYTAGESDADLLDQGGFINDRSLWLCDAQADLPSAAEGAKANDLAFTALDAALWYYTTSWQSLTSGGADTEHRNDTTDAHDASAISVDASGFIVISNAYTDVQETLEGLDIALQDPYVDDLQDVVLSNGGDPPADSLLKYFDGTWTDTPPATTAEIADIADTESAGTSDSWPRGDHVHSGAAYIAKALVDAKGDIVTATAADTPAILAVGTDGKVLTASSGAATGLSWETPGTGVSDADYLVGTAHGGLSAEIVVGTTPGGELGGTWAAPTVDATHSGSTHSAATDTHIADTSAAHAAGSISADSTTLVGTGTDVQAVLEELDNGIADHLADTSDAHDASAISIADAGNDFTATTVEGALDELQADNEAHVAAADPHTGYVLESLLDAAGDLYIASAADTPARLARGSDDQFLRSTGSTIAWESPPFSIVVFLDGGGSPLATGRRPIWNAAFPCTVTAVKAYVDTGTTTVVNAGTTATAGAEEFCSADITIDPADAWESGTVDQNQAIAAGETVGVEVITAGTATQITIQIDLTRP